MNIALLSDRFWRVEQDPRTNGTQNMGSWVFTQLRKQSGCQNGKKKSLWWLTKKQFFMITELWHRTCCSGVCRGIRFLRGSPTGIPSLVLSHCTTDSLAYPRTHREAELTPNSSANSPTMSNTKANTKSNTKSNTQLTPNLPANFEEMFLFEVLYTDMLLSSVTMSTEDLHFKVKIWRGVYDAEINLLLLINARPLRTCFFCGWLP